MRRILILYIFYSVGITGHFIPQVKSVMLFLTPYSILFSMLLVIWKSEILKNKTFLIWLSTIFAATFIIEIIGVKTGDIFGVYKYGDVLGFKVFGTPVLIGLNWAFLIWGFNNITRHLTENKLAGIFLPGFLAVGFDYIMEPAAVKLGYWRWTGGEIPLQNYLSWFLISVICSLFYQVYVKNENDRVIKHFIIVQSLFFVLLNFL